MITMHNVMRPVRQAVSDEQQKNADRYESGENSKTLLCWESKATDGMREP